jgi:anti-anti-sigma regulatory factor
MKLYSTINPLAADISEDRVGCMRMCWTNVENVDVWRLSVEGSRLDAARVERLREAIHTAISTGARGIVIDLQRIDRLDPLGLSGLALLPQEFTPPVRIALAGLRPDVQEAALLVHLHDIVDIYEDARAAVFDLSAQFHQPRAIGNT